jgi:hypothetical protein
VEDPFLPLFHAQQRPEFCRAVPLIDEMANAFGLS